MPLLILVTGAAIGFYVKTMDRRIEEAKTEFNRRLEEIKSELIKKSDKVDEDIRSLTRDFSESQREVDKQMAQLERYGLKMLREYGDATKKGMEALKVDIERIKHYVLKGLPTRTDPGGG